MNKNELLNRVLKILYATYKNNGECQNEAFSKLEQEIGSSVLHELIIELRNRGWTKYNSMLGAKGDIVIVCGKPVLSIDAIEYVENLNKPFWKKLDTRAKLIALITAIGSAIIYFITNILPNLDKIIENLKHYILHIQKNIFLHTIGNIFDFIVNFC